MGNENTEKKVRKRMFVIFGIIAVIVYFFSNKNFQTVLALRKEKNRLNNYLEEVKYKNKDLKKRLSLMKKDPSYLEDMAREKLGMIKKGEIKYKFIDAGKFRSKESVSK